MMADLRKTPAGKKRLVVFTLKLDEQEAADLRQLAEANCRRPGDQMRQLLRDAIAARRQAINGSDGVQ
jgi:predicted transcriptional regulator